jgi:hypothetical protein
MKEGIKMADGEWYESTGRIDFEGDGQPGRDPYGRGEKTIQLMGQSIVARKVDPDSSGIEAFILEDGTEVDLATAITAVKKGDSRGLIAQKGPFGMIIRSSPDGVDDNNLRDLPIANEDGTY